MADFFPKAARVMSEEWFMLLSKLAYLRYNFRHFRAARLPPWADEDAVFTERVEHITELLHQLNEEGQEGEHVQLLFARFQSATRDPYLI